MHDLYIPISEVSTHTLYIDPSQKIAISSRLQCCYDGSSEPVVVKKVTPTQYSLSFTPRKRGDMNCILCTTTHSHILGSPINISVTVEPHQLKPIAKKKIKSVNGIKCHKGLIYLCHDFPESGLQIFENLSKPAKRSIRLPGL